ncbi:MAG: hypothetical protein EOP49_00780 [Sphingobacteriales bacterium]|nr:MAG: hypothetical protein EOP49_00780 [Sphingobacteriales bacterium]
MSLFEDQPGDFYDWISSKGLDTVYAPSDFVPRQLFGDYITASFEKAAAASGCIVNTEVAEISDVIPCEDGWELRRNGNTPIFAHQVILALGNMRPQQLPGIETTAKLHKGYIRNPWGGSFINDIGPNDEVFLSGTGLTMVDILMSLRKNGHQGKVTISSRRGYLPLAHQDAPGHILRTSPAGMGVYNLLSWFRKELAFAEETGGNWISVLNALREDTPLIWQSLSQSDKTVFLRHLKPFWEIHRHRIPAESRRIIDGLLTGGLVTRIAGRISNIKTVGEHLCVSIAEKGSGHLKTVNARWVVNCTGPANDFSRSGNPLVESMLRGGVMQLDEGQLGIRPSQGIMGIHVIGPLSKGTYWECTALREIRKHARQIATTIQKSAPVLVRQIA